MVEPATPNHQKNVAAHFPQCIARACAGARVEKVMKNSLMVIARTVAAAPHVWIGKLNSSTMRRVIASCDGAAYSWL